MRKADLLVLAALTVGPAFLVGCTAYTEGDTAEAARTNPGPRSASQGVGGAPAAKGAPAADAPPTPGAPMSAPEGTAPGSDATSGPSATACDAAGASTVGDMPLRRLTRAQYANSVRDLLAPALRTNAAAKAVEAASRFPADERVGPFSGNPRAPISDAHARLYVDAAELLAEAASRPEALPGLLPCAPTAATEATCAEQFIRAFGRRAFRRPLAPDTVTALKAVYAAGGGFANGIRLVLQAILAAPDFVYYVEPRPARIERGLLPLDGFDVAARLAAFLWDGTPDDPLLAAAEANQLATPAQVRAQAERLLGDARARQALGRLAGEWLTVEGVESLQRDARQFPAFTAALPAAMRTETTDFVDHVVRRGDARLATLIAAPFTLAADPLLRVYGVTRPAGTTAQSPLQLPPAERAGLLTQPGVLAATSHPDGTSPVKRGMLILTNILCHDITFPDGLEVPPLPDPDPKKTTRQRFAQHTTVAACAVCHTVIDPIGFAFERHDAIGTYRAREGTQPVDDSGVLALGDPTLDGPVTGAVELAKKLANAGKVRACVSRQVHRFALARPELKADACTLARLDEAFAKSGYNVRELLLATVTADTFRFRPSP
jgi:hypothetical protein